MTREIAIRYCDEYLARHISDIDKEFLKIAKEALQQQFCDKCVYSTSEGCQYDDITETIPPFEDCKDAISRAELLKAIDTWDKFGYTETGCFVREPKNDCVKYIHYDDVIECIKSMPPVNPQKPICPSAGIDCEDCPAYEDAISRYQKIKQMLYEFKEMPLAPCLMKGHICAVHEILNEVIEPSASSSEKPCKDCQYKEWLEGEDLPSVTPQPNDDAISRQAVLDCFKRWQPYMATRLWEFEQELSALPPVTPQPKMGKCKWVKYDHRTICPKEHDADNPYWRTPENRKEVLKYCPYCGLEIVIDEI